MTFRPPDRHRVSLLTCRKALGTDTKGIDIGQDWTENIGGSIGILIYPETGREIKTLVGQANNAMYKVREAGRNGYCLDREEPCCLDRNING
ncbi:diguanylate cyclase domain-containing protein [Desulforapulum autotrophicum]